LACRSGIRANRFGSDLPDNDTVDTRWMLWQPNREERAWERLPWLFSLQDALPFSARLGLPILRVVCQGDLATGTCCGLGVRVRQWLQSSVAVARISRHWLPVADRLPDRSINQTALPGRGDESERVELRGVDGKVLFRSDLDRWNPVGLNQALLRFGGTPGAGQWSLPRRGWERPPAPDGGLRLEIVSRFLRESQARWVRLDRADAFRSTIAATHSVLLNASEALASGPREGHASPGESWNLDAAVVDRISRCLVPPLMPNGQAMPRVDKASLRADVVSIGRGCSVRFTGDFSVTVTGLDGGRALACTGRLAGYGVFGADRMPKRIRLCTVDGVVGGQAFGAVVGEA
jgi:hypothetical protein